MAFDVISNPAFHARTGFTNAQFKSLDDLYCLAASQKILNYRTVECDFDESIARYTYYVSAYHKPVLQFVIRKTGPQAQSYEVFAKDKGCVAKSGLFERAFEKLHEIIHEMIQKHGNN